jgi:hypothetical protein
LTKAYKSVWGRFSDSLSHDSGWIKCAPNHENL